MCKLIGRFFFKLTDSKNLIGEFSNNFSKRNFTESADRTIPNAADGKFDGEYYSTWHDDEKEHISVLAKLNITRKNENIFSLKWEIVNETGKFWGEGMVCDGILIGDYRNFDPIV